MKEQITNMPKVLLNIAEEMRLMRETINQQHTEIPKLNRNIESLNHQLRKKNKEYEGRDCQKNENTSQTQWQETWWIGRS